MKDLKGYMIPFVGLKEGKHEFDYHLDNEFFEYFGFDEFERSSIDVKVIFEKKSTLFNLDFQIKGTVGVYCDHSGELFDLLLDASYPLVVKFGDSFEEIDESLITIPHNEYQLNLGQYLYEFTVLSVPQRRVKPEFESEELDEEDGVQSDLDILGDGQETNDEEKEDTQIDPRWKELNKLLTGK